MNVVNSPSCSTNTTVGCVANKQELERLEQEEHIHKTVEGWFKNVIAQQ